MALDREILEEVLSNARKNQKITKQAMLAKLELNNPPLAGYISNLCLTYNFDINFVLAILAQEGGLLTGEQLSAMKGIDVGFFQLNYHPENPDAGPGPVDQWKESNRSPLPDPLSATGNADIGVWYLSWVRDWVRNSLSEPPPRNTAEELAVIATANHGLGHAEDYRVSLGLNSLRADYHWKRVMNYYANFSSASTANDFGGILTSGISGIGTTTNIYDAINSGEFAEQDVEDSTEESEYAPVEFPVIGHLDDTGYLRINDIEFQHIPPSQISVTKESMHKQSSALRASSNTFLRTGQTRINIQIVLDFVDQNAPGKPFITAHDYINQKLRPLIAQFLLTPFCSVANTHIATQVYSIVGIGANKDLKSQFKLALALTDFVLTTHPESPGGLRLALNFLYFNYQPFSTDFSYLEDFDEFHVKGLKDPQFLKDKGMENWFRPAASPLASKAFKKFYKNKLATLNEITNPLSSYFTMSFETEPLGSKDPFIPRLNSEIPDETQAQLQQDAATKAANRKNTIESIELDTPNSVLAISGGLKITGLTVSFSNHLSTIPLLSWEYPTIQFLGARDINVSVDFQSIGRNGSHDQLSNLRRFHAIVDRKAISNKSTRRQSVNVVNDILGLVGITNVILNNLETHTTESPELVIGRLSLGVMRKVPPKHDYDPAFDFVATNQNRHSLYKELLKKFIEEYKLKFTLRENPTETEFFDVDGPNSQRLVISGELPNIGKLEFDENILPTPVILIDLMQRIEQILEDNIKDFILEFDPFNLAKSLMSQHDFRKLQNQFIEALSTSESQSPIPVQKVVEVIDGDTIKLEGGGIISIRFLSVNTPETKKDFDLGSVDQPGAQEAKKFLEELVLNKPVYVHSDGIDPYGRTLAYIYLPGGISISGLISAEGYGKGRRIFVSEGARALGRFLDSNYLEIFRLLNSDSRKSLVSIASQIGALPNISYPDFDFTDIVDGVSNQDINPDFYFYNRHEDPTTNLSSIKKITNDAIEIINQQYVKYSEFLFQEAVRGRNERLADMSNVDITKLNITDSNSPLVKANNNPANEPKEDSEQGRTYKPQTQIEHSFDPKAISSLLEYSISNAELSQYKLRRAYPTFQIYFLEEDDVQFGWRSYNDFYTSDTVEFIMVTRSREIPADTAYIRLNNFTGEITRKKFKKVNPETLREDIKSQSAPLVDTISENPAEDLIFREGTRVQVRLGYENNPNKLPIVFNGIITSMSGTDTIEIYCQSFAIELTNTIVSPSSDGLVQLAPGIDLMNYNSNFNTRLLAQRLLRKPEIVHFGRWVAEDGINLWAPLKANLPFLNYETEIRPDGQHVPRWHFLDTPVDDNVFIPDFGPVNDNIMIGFDWFDRWIIPDFIINFFRNSNMRSLTLWTHAFYAQPTLSVWDVLQELTLRYPGYICSTVPFDDRMTVFFGHPNQLYCWRDKTFEEQLRQANNSFNLIDNASQSSQLNQAQPNSTDGLNVFPGSNNSDQIIYPADSYIYNPHFGNSQSFTELLKFKDIVKPFRNYHFVTSYHDIIANEIRADFNGTITVAHINWSAATKDKLRNVSTIKLDDGIPDPDSFEAESFPGAYRDAMFNEINVHTEEEALRYGVSYLCNSLKDLYKGDLVIIGNPEMKPYDRVFIYDDYNDMAGPVDIKQVVHTFSPEYGFTTTITPDCIVEPGDTFNFAFLKALGHSYTSFYKETNEALTQVGWTPSLSGLIAGLGFISGIMKVRGRDPIVITPLVRNGTPWVNGIAGYQRGNYWLEWKGSINRYFTAFKDGLNYFKDNLYESVEGQTELIRRTKIDWKF